MVKTLDGFIIPSNLIIRCMELAFGDGLCHPLPHMHINTLKVLQKWPKNKLKDP